MSDSKLDKWDFWLDIIRALQSGWEMFGGNRGTNAAPDIIADRFSDLSVWDSITGKARQGYWAIITHVLLTEDERRTMDTYLTSAMTKDEITSFQLNVLRLPNRRIPTVRPGRAATKDAPKVEPLTTYHDDRLTPNDSRVRFLRGLVMRIDAGRNDTEKKAKGTAIVIELRKSDFITNDPGFLDKAERIEKELRLDAYLLIVSLLLGETFEVFRATHTNIDGAYDEKKALLPEVEKLVRDAVADEKAKGRTPILPIWTWILVAMMAIISIIGIGFIVSTTVGLWTLGSVIGTPLIGAGAYYAYRHLF